MAFIHVAVATDSAYLPWSATLLRSALLQHPDGSLHFHLLHADNLRSEDVDRLREMVDGGGGELDLHAVGSSGVAQLPAVEPFGPVAWLRLKLPDLLPELDRVLYLDADTLVLAPITPLWQTSLDGAPVAAVANVVEPAQHAHVAAIGIADAAQFFNSGVLLMNLDLMRQEDTFKRLASFADAHREQLLWPDQDSLNGVFAGRWLHLHPRWNAQNSLWFWRDWAESVFGAEQVREATSEPAILHFEGPSMRKPWHYLCEHPRRDDYRRILAQTPWRKTGLEDRTPATGLIKLLPPAARLRAYLRLQRWRAGRARA